MRKFLLIICLTLICFSQVFSQIMTEKKQSKEIPPKRLKTHRYDLEFKDKRKVNLFLEREILEKKEDEPVVFARFSELNINFKSLDRNCEGGNCYYEAEITSKNANIITVLFNNIKLSQNSSIYIINDIEGLIQGPLTAKTLPKTENFITPPIPGETIRILLVEPLEEVGQSKVSISRVSHGIIDMFGTNNYQSSTIQSGSCNIGFGCSAPCNLNIACRPNLNLSANGVALILYQSIDSYNASYHGSGILLNNGKQERIPILMTPIHTYGGLMIRDLQFMFYYRSNDCNPNTDGPRNIVAYNATGLSNPNLTSNTDSRLLVLEKSQFNNPPFINNPVSYLGWSIIDQPITSTEGIHHPRADVQKYISGGSAIKDDQVSNPYFAWRVSMQNGALQTMSSGSPLFNNQLRVIGVNIGGYGPSEDTCEGPNDDARYSRISMAWHEFKQYLDPDNEGIVAMNTITNQPGAKIISEVSGPDVICSNTTFTLVNAPLDATITWEVSKPLLVNNSSGSGKTAVFAPANSSSSGYTNIIFTVSFGSSSKQFIKQIYIGKIPASEVTLHPFDFHPYACPNQTHTVLMFPEVQGYQYELQVTNGTYTQFNPSGFWVHFGNFDTSTPFAVASVSGRINNGCGWSDWRTINIFPDQDLCPPGGGCELCLAYPNPADSELNIDLNAMDENEFHQNQEYEIHLYDPSGNKINSFKTRDKKVTINVRGLKNGYYYLHILHKDGVLRKKIRIER